jgi:hypothetical protein
MMYFVGYSSSENLLRFFGYCFSTDNHYISPRGAFIKMSDYFNGSAYIFFVQFR